MITAIPLSNKVYADENSPEASPANARLFREYGVITGFGVGNIDEGNYQPVLLIWHMGIDLNGFFMHQKTARVNFHYISNRRSILLLILKLILNLE